MSRYQTINAFHQTPSPAQIVSYILFALQIILFYAIIQQRLSSQTAWVILHIIYGTSMVGQIVFTLICSIVDPSDSVMVKYRSNRQQVSSDHLDNYLYCDICKSYVKESARHCRVCGRCVQDFDHHCIWINNCIGGLNYRSFVAMIIFTFCSMTTFITSVGVLWAQKQFTHFLAEMILLWVTAIIVIVFDFLILNLILLHVYLIIRGTTTYNLIVEQRQKKKMQQAQRVKIQANIAQQREMKEKKQKEGEKKQKKEQSECKNLQKEEKLEEEYNRTQDNILDKKQGIFQFSHQNKRDDYNLRQTRINKNIIHIDEEEEHISETESRTSIKISQLFTRNKSLKILISGDAQMPKMVNSSYSTMNKQQIKKFNTVPLQIHPK